MAQVDAGVQAVGQAAGIDQGNTDLLVIVGNVINVLLGLLGVIFLILVLYAGYLWMTAGGDSKQIDSAKAMLRNAVIGLVVIMSAWAITSFIFGSLNNATDTGGVGGGGGIGGGGLGGGGSSSVPFRVKAITPSGAVPLRNVQVRILMTKAVDAKTAQASIGIKRTSDGAAVPGAVVVSGSLITFTPSAACPAPNAQAKCFDADTSFTVTVGGGLRSTGNQQVTCSNAAPCTGSFATGNVVDTAAPTAAITFPTAGMSVSADSIQPVKAAAGDDSGVSLVDFYEGATKFASESPAGSPTPKSFDPDAEWETTGVPLGAHTLFAEAFDIDANQAKSGGVSVMVRPPYCFNGQLDAAQGETGIDCGGQCGACSGGSCSQNADCSSGFCQNGVCVEQPVIASVVPAGGAVGTFVTIKGANFGSQPGNVRFLGDPNNPNDDKVAVAPQVCVDAGIQTWGNTQAIVAVPAGALNGPIRIENATSKLSDRTDDAAGPKIADFQVNDVKTPGLCGLKPSSGNTGATVEAVGAGFGSGNQKVVFGAAEIVPLTANDASVTFKVPVVNAGPNSVAIQTPAGKSNPAVFTVLPKATAAAPVLDAIDPAQGPKSQYITLFGKNFGSSLGTVTFSDGKTQQQAVGDTAFPAQCQGATWKDTQIVVKVPSAFINNQAIALGTYQVSVKRPDGKASNVRDFVIVDGAAAPGICALQPSSGPEKTAVSAIGERFGNVKPQITFGGNVPGAIADADFSNSSIKTAVPAGAVTGKVFVTAGGQSSNKVDFAVGSCLAVPDLCADGEQCCADGTCKPKGQSCGAVAPKAEYAWKMSTGLLPVAPYVVEECRPDLPDAPTPSPAPWDRRQGGDVAPIDSAVVMRFSDRLDPQTVTAKNFQLFACVGQGGDPCAERQPVSYPGLVQVAQNQDQDVVRIRTYAGSDADPVKDPAKFVLKKNTRYLVLVGAAVKATGAAGSAMDVKAECGTAKDGQKYGYCFQFKTRDSDTLAQVNMVKVLPGSYTLDEIGGKTSYAANPLNADDMCIVVECAARNWQWYTGDPSKASDTDARATVTKNPKADAQACVQTATAVQETGTVNPVNVNARIVQASPVVGTGRLYVSLAPPRIVTYGPNCDLSCRNAQVWAQFDRAIDEASVSAKSVVLKRCPNENCNLDDLVNAEPIAIKPQVFDTKDIEKSLVDLNPVQGALIPEAYYYVLFRGGPQALDGIRGRGGVPLGGLNHPQGFGWKFRVKPDPGSICKADRVVVDPLEKVEDRVGAAQLFAASPYGAPDQCSAQGQRLVASGGTSWGVADKAVAKLYQDGKVALGGALPAGCTASCRLAGAPISLAQKGAICGDGLVEAAKGEECEPGVGATGAFCGTDCRLLDNTSQTCGDGVLEAAKGEECDFKELAPSCYGAKPGSGIVEGSPCGTAAVAQACTAAGGACERRPYRGCSATCKHLGSIAGNSVCGNASIGDGEDCDDGNAASGDGCSAICLNEGASPKSVVYAVCGNGTLEPGEACETSKDKNGNPVPFAPGSGCNPTTCLRTGTFACGVLGQGANCCGNGGKPEVGEDCDDGNALSGDGCSASCLAEGSSAKYLNAAGVLEPSFCGDAVKGRGEQCEAAALPQGAVADRVQLAYIVGEKEPDADGRQMTKVQAAAEGKSGEASYGLVCGKVSEDQCPAGFGLDDRGCCAERPKLATAFPPKDASAVCRNARLTAIFTPGMRVSTVVNNVQVLEEKKGTCPAGTTTVVFDADETPLPAGWRGRVAAAWRMTKEMLLGVAARAQVLIPFPKTIKIIPVGGWCAGGVTGQWRAAGSGADGAMFTFAPDDAFKPNTKYLVRFAGDADLSDNAQLANRTGVRTARGVVQPASTEANGPLSWTFTTGADICKLSDVVIEDVTPAPADGSPAHPFLFVNPGNAPETRDFLAAAVSLQEGVSIPLAPTKSYAWEWDWWSSANPNLVKIADDAGKSDKVKAISAQLNGTTVLTANLAIVTDSVFGQPGQYLQGHAPVTVSVCRNPWPSLKTAPFRDMQGSPSGADLTGADPQNPFQGNYFNFSTMYCRDAGDGVSLDDDLPPLRMALVPQSQVDQARGILRQYLLTYPSEYPQYKQDGIGIRIATNPLHLGPEEWYAAQGFTGSPQSVTVDGYPAVRDGATVYVAATNRQPGNDTGKIFSNIYVLSHNPDADAVTTGIFDQLLATLSFNVNLSNQSNVCVVPSQGGGVKPFAVEGVNGGRPVACSTDWDCLKYGNDKASCDANKAKLQRDTVRFSDFLRMSKGLDASRDATGSYPKALAGTFLPGSSNSRWASWSQEIGAAAGLSMPQDPINRFLACGRCSVDVSNPCQSSDDCPAGQTCRGGYLKGNVFTGQTWTFDDDVDPGTCWNTAKSIAMCPRFGTAQSGASRVYQYKVLNGGAQYELSAEFELPPNNPDAWWSPPLPTATYRCVNPETKGRACSGEDAAGDAQCRPCSGDACANVPVTKGSCRRTGGVLTFANVCTGQAQAAKGICGDGVLNPGELCEVNETKYASCKTADGKNGNRRQVCDACTKFVDDVANPQCLPKAFCGDGKVNKSCQNGPLDSGVSCNADADCAKVKSGSGQFAILYPSCAPTPSGNGGKGEVCDEGALNGKYGHCNASCSGYDTFCGDGKLSPGETCDLGAGKNGVYGSACSLDCKGPGPTCGDNQVNGAEMCDGGTETTTDGLCITKFLINGYHKATDVACKTDADCGADMVCGATASVSPNAKNPKDTFDGNKSAYGFASCAGLTFNGRATQHVRTCGAPGAANACQYPGWSPCTPVGACGDGILDQGEECDDGSGNADTAACTSSCKKNACGDGKVNVGVEECDAGANNGKPICSAEYNSSCLACGNSCKFLAVQGGYCGNGIKEGSEQCDGSASATCASLGYDFSLAPGGKAQCAPTCQFAGCGRCSDAIGDGKLKGYVYDALFQQVVPNARVTLLHKGVKVEEKYTSGDGYFEFTSVNNRPECTQYRLAVDMYQDNPCTGQNPGASCRKSLVAEFPKGVEVDEGELGGYFPYETQPFAPTEFDKLYGGTAEEPAHINLFPRPKKGMAYVSMLWPGGNAAPGSLHTVLPKKYAYTKIDDGKDGLDQKAEICGASGNDARLAKLSDSDQIAICTRDVNWRSYGTRNPEVEAPFARLYCIHRAGEKTGGNSLSWYNNCPIEGTDACMLNCDKGAAVCKDACGLGSANTAPKGYPYEGQSVCSKDPSWESCFFVRHPPVTAYVNVAQMADAGEPVRFLFRGSWSGSSAPTAYLATNEKLDVIKAPASVADQSWEVATIGASGVFAPTQNKAGGSHYHDQGQACYTYAYQCGGDSYCQEPGKEPVPCYGQTDWAKACPSGCKPLAKPVPAPSTAPSYYYYNW